MLTYLHHATTASYSTINRARSYLGAWRLSIYLIPSSGSLKFMSTDRMWSDYKDNTVLGTVNFRGFRAQDAVDGYKNEITKFHGFDRKCRFITKQKSQFIYQTNTNKALLPFGGLENMYVNIKYVINEGMSYRKS